MKLVQVEHLSKHIQGRLLLSDISLEIPQACIYGIFGRSGSGKSLLIRCLAGLDRPDNGTNLISRKIPHSAALQSPGLAPELTLYENLLFSAALTKVAVRRRTSHAAHIMQDMGLSDYRNVRACMLPFTVAAKAEIARILVTDAQLVFIDGLLDMLDPKSCEEVWRVILAMRREKNVTFVIATANATHADLCDELTIIHRGRVVASGITSQLKASARADLVIVDGVRNASIKSKIKKRFAAAVEEVEGHIKFTSADGNSDIIDLLAEYGSEVGAIYLRRPSLADLLEDLIRKGGSDV